MRRESCAGARPDGSAAGAGGGWGGGRAGAGAAPVLRLAGAGLYGKTRMRAGIFST